jgi:hypothetical protein
MVGSEHFTGLLLDWAAGMVSAAVAILRPMSGQDKGGR